MSDHTTAIESAMKAAGFDPRNPVARKSAEDLIAAYLSERGGDPVVKPLEWSGPDSSADYHGAAPLGLYTIRAYYPDRVWLTVVGQYFPTVDEAKAAAQADYSGRIRSAIAVIDVGACSEDPIAARSAYDAASALSLAQAEIEKLREALEFYRDGFSYHPKRSRTGINLSEWKATESLLEDCGERARAALESKGGDGSP